MSFFKYVCLGGGNASGYVAKELVARGLQPGSLCVITREAVVAYERPALSKAFLAPKGAARLPGFHACVGGGGERQEPSWYTEKGITYKVNSTATAVDLVNKTINLQNGEVISYDKLIIATGAEAVRLSDFSTPGADLEGVHYLRDVADGQALLAAVEVAEAGSKQVVIIGGGYIGMEVAAGLSAHDVQVTMVFPQGFLLARLFTPELAAFYEAYYAAKNIKMVKKSLVKEVLGEGGKVSGVRLSDGSALPASLVVVGVGARPASQLFKGQLQLDQQGGIVVDGTLQSSVPGVYAIGDVASFPLVCEGNAMARQEHVTHARLSAAHVVAAIMGETKPYDYLPYFYSREFALSWQFYGVTAGADQVVHWGDMSPTAATAAAACAATPKFGAYWLRDGRVVGAFMEGANGEESAALKSLGSSRPKAPPVEELVEQGVAFAMQCKL